MRLSTFVLESCLALLMPNGPATPADRRAANGAPRVFQLSFSFRRPLCRRGIVLGHLFPLAGTDLPTDAQRRVRRASFNFRS